MRGLALIAISFAFALCVGVASAYAEPLSAADAVALGRAGDGRTIEVQGEAVGEALRAQSGKSWVNVLSGGVALGIVMDETDADAVSAFGRYSKTGSTVLVRGVYNVACDQHGGDLDVHAVEVTVLDDGSVWGEAPDWWQLALSLGLFATAGVAVVLRRRARRLFETG